MVLVCVDDESRSSTNTLPLMGVGDDFVTGEVDDLLEWLVGSLPAFAHEHTVNSFFFDKGVKFLNVIVNTSWIHIHHICKV